MANVTMRQMLEAGVHFGHQTRYWNPKMATFIFGERNKIHIINLEKSLPLLKDACNFLGQMAANRGKVLFVGTKRSAQDAVRAQAERCGMPYVNHRWLGGMLTNFQTVKQSVSRLKELEQMTGDTSSHRLGKKELLHLSRETDKLKKSLDGIKDMASLPDALFIIDVGYERIAVNEAVKLGIPVVAVVDSNNSMEGVDYVIPGNDDAIRAVQLYTSVAAESILESVAQARLAAGSEDEFIELGDDGEFASPSARPSSRPAGRVKKKSTIKKPDHNDQSSEASDSTDQPAAIKESAEASEPTGSEG